MDASIVVYGVAALSERMSRTLGLSQFLGWIMGVFAALALTLTWVGLYGLMAYLVRQRTREFGIRIAMGATSGQVAAMVIRKGMLLVGAGLTIGVVVAGALARMPGTLLFGISYTDPLTFLGVAAILAAVALVAVLSPCPARRTARSHQRTAVRIAGS